MKKILSVILLLVVVISLASCRGASSVNGETFTEVRKETNEITTEAETTGLPLGEYVVGTQGAKIGEKMSKPEIETDTSKLNNFYVVSENTESFYGIEEKMHIKMSVKGLHEDRTEFVFTQDSKSNIREDMEVNVFAICIFVFDNVNKTAKVFEAQSMGTDVTGGVVDGENQMNGILSSILGDGGFNDISDRYTYDEAHSYMKAILGMYSGIYFSEYLKAVDSPMEFEKSADEGDCFVYYSEAYGESLKFKIDRNTGLFQHASFTGREHLVVTEYSFTEYLHTEADIAATEK